MWVELQTIINEFIDLFWHYIHSYAYIAVNIHSLQIMKIVKFFLTLVCIDLPLGGEVGSSTPTSFFLLQTMIVYHMHSKHVCIICTPKSISVYKLHAE